MQAHGFHIETTHIQSLFNHCFEPWVSVLPTQQERFDHGPFPWLLASSLLQLSLQGHS
jgi:hypothetical protein